MPLPYNSVLSYHSIGIVLGNAESRNLSVNLVTDEFGTLPHERHSAYVVMTPAVARQLALDLLVEAAKAEALSPASIA